LITAGGAKTSIDDLFGILSMLAWSLIMVVTQL
jgi:K+ transporter